MRNIEIRQAVILAGGIGTRLRPLTYGIPKPMAPVNGRPFLEYLIDLLRDNGIFNIILLVGYMHHKIVEYFGDGSNYGVSIKFSIGDVSFETGTRLRNAEDLFDDHFLLMYSDNYWPLNLQKLVEFYNNHDTPVAMTVYSNRDKITKNNILIADDYVLKYDRTRKDADLNGVDIGFFIVQKSIFNLMPDNNSSFEEVIMPQLIENRELSGYQTHHCYYSIGTPEKLLKTERFLQQKKVVLLDRDGVINKKPPKADYVKKWEEFEFLSGAVEAVSLLTKNGYKLFIITNQAGIARGLMSENDLKEIHTNLLNTLEGNNAKVEKIYYCPHGWNDGCECRKPMPGMLFQAASEYQFDLTKALFIGDDERDVQAGTAAGCKTILVNFERNLLQIAKDLIG